ncbi:hypothetical protein HanPI659440_Chr12g0460541 [Helianthus annuus]|uniref:uncharacterized protein LOC110894999 n=1 Tax=Helianthus annuus TaxID=4232 RepID=UPI001652BEF3|nr:uncharacterized protein LOC110894999 [Helianthus annuus]KAJ0725589.1 hypothetical protein HanPI659440_Chr12g0460541 [Helianthus annuus]
MNQAIMRTMPLVFELRIFYLSKRSTLLIVMQATFEGSSGGGYSRTGVKDEARRRYARRLREELEEDMERVATGSNLFITPQQLPKLSVGPGKLLVSSRRFHTRRLLSSRTRAKHDHTVMTGDLFATKNIKSDMKSLKILDLDPGLEPT